jgi:hypothetical protein
MNQVWMLLGEATHFPANGQEWIQNSEK